MNKEAGHKPRPSGWGKPGSYVNRGSLLLAALSEFTSPETGTFDGYR